MTNIWNYGHSGLWAFWIVTIGLIGYNGFIIVSLWGMGRFADLCCSSVLISFYGFIQCVDTTPATRVMENNNYYCNLFINLQNIYAKVKARLYNVKYIIVRLWGQDFLEVICVHRFVFTLRLVLQSFLGCQMVSITLLLPDYSLPFFSLLELKYHNIFGGNDPPRGGGVDDNFVSIPAL